LEPSLSDNYCYCFDMSVTPPLPLPFPTMMLSPKESMVEPLMLLMPVALPTTETPVIRIVALFWAWTPVPLFEAITACASTVALSENSPNMALLLNTELRT
jgi:hypothetical protein